MLLLLRTMVNRKSCLYHLWYQLDSLPCPACEDDSYTDGFGNAYIKNEFNVFILTLLTLY